MAECGILSHGSAVTIRSNPTNCFQRTERSRGGATGRLTRHIGRWQDNPCCVWQGLHPWENNMTPICIIGNPFRSPLSTESFFERMLSCSEVKDTMSHDDSSMQILLFPLFFAQAFLCQGVMVPDSWANASPKLSKIQGL